MDREGVKHALETKRMQEDARTSARLRMLLGASRDAVSDSTRDDNPEDSKTLPRTLLEGKAEIENEIQERPQDTNCNRPGNLSQIRKLSDANDGCQGCGKRFRQVHQLFHAVRPGPIGHGKLSYSASFSGHIVGLDGKVKATLT